jgi:peptidoglycan L-alanyl-D-glutamate endopeptidase CwlK
MRKKPTKELKMVNLNDLHPELQAKIPLLLVNCKNRGAEYKVTCGLRTVDEQNVLFAQGRTTPGPIVTKARGGESYHNFGVAVDATRIIGGKAVWDVESYRILAEEAKKLGLEPGFYWKFQDCPHIQLPFQLKDLQATFAKGGLKAICLLTP